MTRIPMAAVPTAHPTANRRSLRRAALISAPLLALLLGGCDTVSGWFGKTPDPPLPGQRVSVLTRERKVEVDPRLAGTPVALPPATVNAAWAQAGGTAEHAGGNLGLSATPGEAWRGDVGAGASSSRSLLATP
ncbi:hypothetical protein QSG27_17600, partial [Azospirillum sp. C340-1]|nr:hypothetical protein [Azospirillum isscasi]